MNPIHRVAFCLLLLVPAVSASAAIQRPLTPVREWESIDTRFHSAADIDNDGNRELIVQSQSNRDVLVLREDGSPRGYAVLGRIPGKPGDRVIVLDTLQISGDSRLELVIAWTGGRLVVVDGSSLQVIAETRITGFVEGLGGGDVDGDGAPELLLRRFSNLAVLSPTSLQTLGSMPFPRATSSARFQVGDVHGDARAEVVAADGVAYSISRSGQTYTATPVWTSPRGPLLHFDLADVDADGKLEAVAARYAGGVGIERISPAPAYTPLAEFAINYGIWLEDITGDGMPEALVSCGCDAADLLALTLHGTELWRLRQFHVNGVTVLRRSSGELSLVLGNDWELQVQPLPGASGSGWAIGRNLSNSTSGSTFYNDGGETRTAILALSGAGYGVGAVELWDARLRDVGGSGTSWLPTAPQPPQQIQATEIVAIERPDRPQDVLAVIGSFTANWVNGAPVVPRIWLMDRTGALVRERAVASSLTPISAVRWRAANEAQPRVAIAGRVDTGSVRLQTIGTDDGLVAWQSELLALGNGLSVPLQAADLDADGSDELMAQVGADLLVFAPGSGTTPVRVHAGVTAASVLPAQGPSAAQLLLARADGQIYVHAGLEAAPLRQVVLGFAYDAITAFRDPESAQPLLAATDGTTALRVHQLVDGEAIASSPYASYGDRLTASDIDRDGRVDIVASGSGHTVLRLGSAEIIHDNGFE